MRQYLDTSVLVPTIIVEPATTGVEEFILTRADDLTVSEFAAVEVASALSRLVRTQRLTATQAMERLADFDDWRAGAAQECEVTTLDCRLAGRYVRRFELKLRAPDALHAAICHRLGFQLVTLDLRLAAAARQLGIAVAVPVE